MPWRNSLALGDSISREEISHQAPPQTGNDAASAMRRPIRTGFATLTTSRRADRAESHGAHRSFVGRWGRFPNALGQVSPIIGQHSKPAPADGPAARPVCQQINAPHRVSCAGTLVFGGPQRGNRRRRNRREETNHEANFRCAITVACLCVWVAGTCGRYCWRLGGAAGAGIGSHALARGSLRSIGPGRMEEKESLRAGRSPA